MTDKHTHQPCFGICVRPHKETACSKDAGKSSCHAHEIQRLKLVRDRFSNAEGHQGVLAFPLFFCLESGVHSHREEMDGIYVDTNNPHPLTEKVHLLAILSSYCQSSHPQPVRSK